MDSPFFFKFRPTFSCEFTNRSTIDGSVFTFTIRKIQSIVYGILSKDSLALFIPFNYLYSILIFIKKEFLLLIVGGIFVMEAVSVILQVASFRFRKKRMDILRKSSTVSVVSLCSRVPYENIPCPLVHTF